MWTDKLAADAEKAIDECVDAMLAGQNDEDPNGTPHEKDRDIPSPNRHESENDHILGCYYRFDGREPPTGAIELYTDPLAVAFARLIAALPIEHALKRSDLRALASAMAAKTLVHAQFHHLVDVVRFYRSEQLRDRPERETRMAYAFSYRVVSSEGGGPSTGWPRISDDVRRDFLYVAYDSVPRKHQDWDLECALFGDPPQTPPSKLLLSFVEGANAAQGIHAHPAWLAFYGARWRSADAFGSRAPAVIQVRAAGPSVAAKASHTYRGIY